MKKTKKAIELGVIWFCQMCGAYNLHPLNEKDFICINCEYALRAEVSDPVIIIE